MHGGFAKATMTANKDRRTDHERPQLHITVFFEIIFSILYGSGTVKKGL